LFQNNKEFIEPEFPFCKKKNSLGSVTLEIGIGKYWFLIELKKIIVMCILFFKMETLKNGSVKGNL
jgi:hypothetical protein